MATVRSGFVTSSTAIDAAGDLGLVRIIAKIKDEGLAPKDSAHIGGAACGHDGLARRGHARRRLFAGFLDGIDVPLAISVLSGSLPKSNEGLAPEASAHTGASCLWT